MAECQLDNSYRTLKKAPCSLMSPEYGSTLGSTSREWWPRQPLFEKLPQPCDPAVACWNRRSGLSAAEHPVSDRPGTLRSWHALRRSTTVTRAASSRSTSSSKLCRPSALRDRRLRRGAPERPAAEAPPAPVPDHLADRRRPARAPGSVRQHPHRALGEPGGVLARAGERHRSGPSGRR